MIIDGKYISSCLKEKLAEQVASFPDRFGRVPYLVVVRVGEDPASWCMFVTRPRLVRLLELRIRL